MTRRTTELTIVTFRVVEEIDDRPSLPPQPVVETTGEDAGDTRAFRPLAKCTPREQRLKVAR